ncbi:MAG: acyltransferase family protein [Eggerthellaceae bacterium]|nr:acyltransferase family protein [Eggerthellaceae bacterium]
MAKERLAYFDNVKGVLIVLVVVGHILEPVATSSNLLTARVVDFIYLFHMPLFIFASGLFCKSVFRDGKYRIDVPLYYLALCFLLYSGLQVERLFLGTFKSYSLLTMGGGSISWYLMALAAFVIAVPFFSRLKPSVALAGSIVIAVMTGYHNPGDFLTAARICVYLPFFLMGYYINSSSIEGLLARLQEKGVLVAARIAAALVLIALFAMLFTLGSDGLVFLKKLFTARNSYGTILSSSGMNISWWLMGGFRLAYYLVVVVASACVMLLVPRRKLGLVTRAGLCSLQVYFFHPFVYYALNNLGFSKAVYAAMPEVAGLFVLVAFSVLLAIGLAVLKWPQKFFDAIRGASAKLAA